MAAGIKRRQGDDVIVALDIGTSKVAVGVARIKPDGDLEVVGLGVHPSRGLRKGVVVDINQTVNAIQQALEKAEQMAGIAIESVYVGVAGSHVQSRNATGVIAVRGGEITEEDIDRVIETANTVDVPNNEHILHVLPKHFTIDSQQHGIRHPLGMSAKRLEVEVHIVTASGSAVQNIVKSVERCGLTVEKVVLEQLASAEAVLAEDEKELGVCLVDIGGGTTDIAVYHEGVIIHTGVIPVAGDQVTNDVAVALRTPPAAAEEIKRLYGSCVATLIPAHEEIEVPSIGDRPARCMTRGVLAEVIGPRMRELFMLVRRELEEKGMMGRLAAGVVLTGGCSHLNGVLELAEEVFQSQVRLGVPQGISAVEDISLPEYSTMAGLLRYGEQHEDGGESAGALQPLRNSGGGLSKLLAWLRNSF